MQFQQAFIIGYPHAGASILQAVLNAEPGICIRGENAGTMVKLVQIASDLEALKHAHQQPQPPHAPFYGVSDMRVQAYVDQLFSGFRDHLLRPDPDARIWGFADTQHLMPYPQLVAYCNYLRRRFPEALLVFATRDNTAAQAANRAAKSPEADPALLARAKNQFETYAAAHPERCLVLQYEDYVADPAVLRPLYERLGLDADTLIAGSTPTEALSRAEAARAGVPNPPPLGLIKNGALSGRNGWLFLWDGSNEVHRYYTEPDFFTDADTQGWVDLLTSRRDRLASLGARYRHMTVPDKLTLYPDQVGRPLPHADRHPAGLVAARLPGDGLNVDIKAAMLETAKQAATYRRTDTHWTFEGCQTGYHRLCQALGVTPQDFSDRKSGSRSMVMDLGNKFTPQVLEEAHFTPLMRDSRRVSVNAQIRFNEETGFAEGKPRFVGCYMHMQNDRPDARPETVMLFGDSFSEFRPHQLTAMLSETFRNVHFVWSTGLDWDLIERIRPNIVITEIAERFMSTLPRDDLNVSLD